MHRSDTDDTVELLVSQTGCTSKQCHTGIIRRRPVANISTVYFKKYIRVDVQAKHSNINLDIMPIGY